MLLCIDVGNTQIHGGVFNGRNLFYNLGKPRQQFSSDEVGIFLRSVLRENKIDSDLVNDISICSVVPDLNHSLRNGCLKYFNKDPFFLKPGVKTDSR